MALPRSGASSGDGIAEVTTPQDYPRGTPPISAVDHSWVFQATMEIQKSIGKLEQAIGELRAETKAHGNQLAKLEKIFYAAGIVGMILLGVGGFLINKLWDPVVSALITYAKSAR